MPAPTTAHVQCRAGDMQAVYFVLSSLAAMVSALWQKAFGAHADSASSGMHIVSWAEVIILFA